MKKYFARIIVIVLTCCFSAFVMTSCGPRVQKPDDAFDLVKKERMLSQDSSYVSEEIIQASLKTQLVKKVETVDEWTKFKLETEKQIRLNGVKIQKIKDKSNLKASQRRKLADLESENNKLKSSLEEYPEAVKAKWEAYKSSMHHNANTIGMELSVLEPNQGK